MCGLLILYCFWSLTSLFFFLSSLFSPPAPSFSPTKGQDFFWGQIFFCLPPSYPFILSLSSTYLFPSKKEAWKLCYTSHSHKLDLAEKRKASKPLRHQEITLRSPCLQQPNEDVKSVFNDTTSANFSGFPLLRKENVLASKFFQHWPHTNRDLGK